MPLNQGGVLGKGIQILKEGDELLRKLYVLQDPPHRGMGNSVKSLIKINVKTIRKRDITEFQNQVKYVIRGSAVAETPKLGGLNEGVEGG